MNTGTPDAPTIEAVRRYLGEFLMDPAIIGAPPFVRRRIVAHVCKRRPRRTVRNYEAFWTPKGSPFMLASLKQRDRLAIELAGRIAESTQVALGMRYGNPSIAHALGELRDGGCEQVILLPLYPQQVNVCAGTCLAKAREELGRLAATSGWQPQVIEVPHFYEQPAYQQALARSVQQAWTYEPGSKLVASFHSTMMADINRGDPYREQAQATTACLAANLGIPAPDVLLCYQSRFDSRRWLQPFTETTLLELAEQGVKRVCVVCPGFTAENIETAIEVGRDLRGAFLSRAGVGASFTQVPSLNASSGLIKALAAAVCEARVHAQLP